MAGCGARAIVYADKGFETGYNVVYVALFDSANGSALNDGHFDLEPIMDMGTMQHGSPVENTEDETPTNGYYRSAAVFSMPGNTSQWKLNMTFHNHKNDKEGLASLGVEVKQSSPARLKITTVDSDTTTKDIYISYLEPSKPAVGINDFEIVIHSRVSSMEYTSEEGYTIEIEPTMPSMGHGSPNNVNPVHQGRGHYKGKVNFTMTGLWNIKLKIYKGGVLLSDDQFFEVTLQ